jgi:uncharacterized protein (UPF0335 family)
MYKKGELKNRIRRKCRAETERKKIKQNVRRWWTEVKDNKNEGEGGDDVKENEIKKWGKR